MWRKDQIVSVRVLIKILQNVDPMVEPTRQMRIEMRIIQEGGVIVVKKHLRHTAPQNVKFCIADNAELVRSRDACVDELILYLLTADEQQIKFSKRWMNGHTPVSRTMRNTDKGRAAITPAKSGPMTFQG